MKVLIVVLALIVTGAALLLMWTELRPSRETDGE